MFRLLFPNKVIRAYWWRGYGLDVESWDHLSCRYIIIAISHRTGVDALLNDHSFAGCNIEFSEDDKVPFRAHILDAMRPHRLTLAAMMLSTAGAAQYSALADNRLGAPAWLTEFLRTAPDKREIRSGGVVTEYYSLRSTESSSMHYSLRLIFIRMRPGPIRLHVQNVRQEAGVAEIMEHFSDSVNDIVVVNGGFFVNNNGNGMTPMGLVISEGKATNAARNWSSGGVLAETADGHIAITSIRSFRLDQSVREGLQSRPLLVKQSRSGIRSDNHELANRTAVALCVDGSVLVAGAFSDDGRALSLYEFAAVLTKVQTLTGAAVVDAINLDGGPGSHVYIPSLNLHFGGNAVTYVPNMLRFSGKE